MSTTPAHLEALQAMHGPFPPDRADAFRLSEGFTVYNTASGVSIESRFTARAASMACDELNGHEARNGRPAVYAYRKART